MNKSSQSVKVDEIQAALHAWLKPKGFRKQGRTFNRTTDDGLVQVVNIQMGASDPPGTVYIPGLRENLYGWFTINLGVYVPEVARFHGGGEAKRVVNEAHCCVRSRLGNLAPEKKELWWRNEAIGEVIPDVLARLERHGLPFLDVLHRETLFCANGRTSPRSKALAAVPHELCWRSFWPNVGRRMRRGNSCRSRC